MNTSIFSKILKTTTALAILTIPSFPAFAMYTTYSMVESSEEKAARKAYVAEKGKTKKDEPHLELPYTPKNQKKEAYRRRRAYIAGTLGTIEHQLNNSPTMETFFNAEAKLAVLYQEYGNLHPFEKEEKHYELVIWRINNQRGILQDKEEAKNNILNQFNIITQLIDSKEKKLAQECLDNIFVQYGTPGDFSNSRQWIGKHQAYEELTKEYLKLKEQVENIPSNANRKLPPVPRSQIKNQTQSPLQPLSEKEQTKGKILSDMSTLKRFIDSKEKEQAQKLCEGFRILYVNSSNPSTYEAFQEVETEFWDLENQIYTIPDSTSVAPATEEHTTASTTIPIVNSTSAPVIAPQPQPQSTLQLLSEKEQTKGKILSDMSTLKRFIDSKEKEQAQKLCEGFRILYVNSSNPSTYEAFQEVETEFWDLENQIYTISDSTSVVPASEEHTTASTTIPIINSTLASVIAPPPPPLLLTEEKSKVKTGVLKIAPEPTSKNDFGNELAEKIKAGKEELKKTPLPTPSISQPKNGFDNEIAAQMKARREAIAEDHTPAFTGYEVRKSFKELAEEMTPHELTQKIADLTNRITEVEKEKAALPPLIAEGSKDAQKDPLANRLAHESKQLEICRLKNERESYQFVAKANMEREEKEKKEREERKKRGEAFRKIKAEKLKDIGKGAGDTTVTLLDQIRSFSGKLKAVFFGDKTAQETTEKKVLEAQILKFQSKNSEEVEKERKQDGNDHEWED